MSNSVEIEDTFAEAFPMLATRILITAQNEEWARIAGRTASGFASSIIMSPAEAGMEGPLVPPEKTPDGRPGIHIQMYHRTGHDLKAQMILRIGQCILTCPTTAAFDAMPHPRKRLKIGNAIRMFGDGFEKKEKLGEKLIWKIPVMEGEFIIENKFGLRRCVAGGNFLIMAENQKIGLDAAQKAVSAMTKIEGVVLTFPGGICRSGSKVGAMKYKLPASTNQFFAPLIKESVPESKVPDGVKSIYEIVFNGITQEVVKKATAAGVKAAIDVQGVKKISAVNFGGKLGPFQIGLKEALSI